MFNIESFPANLCVFYDYRITEPSPWWKFKAPRLVYQSAPILCRSFVQQFLQWLYLSTYWQGAYFPNVTDTSGIQRTIGPSNIDLDTTATTGDTTHGIQVGTGTNPVTIGDYKLQTRISHGTSSGLLQYSSVTYGAPSADATKTTFRTTRVLTNASGGTITITELGLVSTNGSYYFLLMRDLTSISVDNGQAVTINYNMITYA